MPLLHTQFPPTPSLPLPFLRSLSLLKPSITFSTNPFKLPRKSISISSCSTPKSLPSTEQEILDFIAESEKKNLPGVRIYENDLARLTLIGDVALQQALTAAAADGGEAADEHIQSGKDTMVVETVFPGHADEHSTVSTRLFLPARKVKEKARKLKNTLPRDLLSSTRSRNILAMTFRQVVLQQIWSFELGLFDPGAERNMGALQNPREVPEVSTLSSSDEWALSVLAEAVCTCVLESTERDLRKNTNSTTSNSIFSWFQKPERIASKDFSVFLYRLSEDEIVQNAYTFLKNFKKKANGSLKGVKNVKWWWTSTTYSKLEKIGGAQFTNWAMEYIPAYKLEVDAEKIKNVKFKGWKKSSKNRWEVCLTHSQMVGLADILDMYYEDVYTLPDKQLSCKVDADFPNLSKSKIKSSLLKLLSITLASGFCVVFSAILCQIWWPHLNKSRRFPSEHHAVSLSEFDCYKHQALEATELEGLCVTIIKKIKDAVGWPGDIVTDTDLGAWTGELPSCLKLHDANLVKEVSSHAESTATHSVRDLLTPSDTYSTEISMSNESSIDTKASVQDIASYQVVLSNGGKIVGFQPTSRLAVNHWASNPLAKELYNGRTLSPSFLEPGLKILPPDEIIVIELLMSVNTESWFALARPVRGSC